MKIERRRFRRHDVLGARGSMEFATELRVLDMSLTGLAVETTFAMDIGEVYPLKLRGRRGQLDVPAKVIRCRLHGSRPNNNAFLNLENVYRIGLDFSAVAREKADEIGRFMASHVVVELEHKVAGSFTLQDSRNGTEDSSDNESDSGFHTRSLSATGMIVETDAMGVPPQGTLVQIDLAEGDLQVRVPARVDGIKQRDVTSGGRFVVRLRFENLPPDVNAKLDAYIRANLE